MGRYRRFDQNFKQHAVQLVQQYRKGRPDLEDPSLPGPTPRGQRIVRGETQMTGMPSRTASGDCGRRRPWWPCWRWRPVNAATAIRCWIACGLIWSLRPLLGICIRPCTSLASSGYNPAAQPSTPTSSSQTFAPATITVKDFAYVAPDTVAPTRDHHAGTIRATRPDRGDTGGRRARAGCAAHPGVTLFTIRASGGCCRTEQSSSVRPPIGGGTVDDRATSRCRPTR